MIPKFCTWERASSNVHFVTPCPEHKVLRSLGASSGAASRRALTVSMNCAQSLRPWQCFLSLPHATHRLAGMPSHRHESDDNPQSAHRGRWRHRRSASAALSAFWAARLSRLSSFLLSHTALVGLFAMYPSRLSPARVHESVRSLAAIKCGRVYPAGSNYVHNLHEERGQTLSHVTRRRQ